MTPEGRNRRCASCNRQVHDLARYTADEIVALVGAAGHPLCGHAEILQDGRVRTRAGMLMLAAVAAASAPAAADTVSGIRVSVSIPAPSATVQNPNPGDAVASVTVTGDGVTRTAQGRRVGDITFGDLPPGRYRIDLTTRSIFTWSIPDVRVCAGTMSVRQTQDPRIRYIVTGMMVPVTPNLAPPPPGYQRSQSGQGEIGGRLAAVDGTAIGGATVTITRSDGLTVSATSGDDGRFEQHELAPGDYAVTISGPGVRPEMLPKVTVLDKYRLPLDLEVCRLER
jgi:hypothetical protein